MHERGDVGVCRDQSRAFALDADNKVGHGNGIALKRLLQNGQILA